MESNSNLPPIQSVLPVVPLTRDRKVARVISRVASPPFLAAFGIILLPLVTQDRIAWLWSSISIILSIIFPVAYILFLVKTRRITDFDIYRREQRFWPYMVTLACSGLNCLLLSWFDAPRLLLILALAGLVQTAMMFLITFWWKISAHAAAASSFSILVFLLAGSKFAPVFILVPLVAWSRVRLHRHTLGQTIAGALMGIGVFTLAAFLV